MACAARAILTALGLAVLGVFLLINVRWTSDPIGLFWAFLNGTLFVGYICSGTGFPKLA